MCKEEEGLASVPCDVGQEGGREGSGWQRPVPSACHQGLGAAGRRTERVDCWMVVGGEQRFVPCSGSCRASHRLGILSGGGSKVALAAADASQVWSLTKFYSVDFSQSRIGVKKCVFNKRTIKVGVSCC